MGSKKKWDDIYLNEIIKRDNAELIKPPERFYNQCFPIFRCGLCKKEVVNNKQFRNMDKYGCICKKCANMISKEKREESLLEKHGVKNPNDIPGIANKIKETRALNLGEDEIRENAKNMVNARWDKEKEKAEDLENEGSQKCIECNVVKKLEFFTFNINKTRKHKVYKKLCKICHNKRRAMKRDEQNQKNTLKNFMENIIKDAKRRSEKKKNGYDINVDNLLELYKNQDGKCYYTGRIMKYNMSKNEHEGKRICPDRITIDRIDSSKGYIKENIVLCCWTANNLKQDLCIDEFKSIVKDIYDNFIKKDVPV